MSKSMDATVFTQSVPTAHYDVVVLGAGPYGLSVAAHLLGQGLNVAIFGKTMELWHTIVPKGMLLRSYWWATDLSDPQKQFDLAHYFSAHNLQPFDPVPGEMIADYGHWFQQHAVPSVDDTYIQTIEQKDGAFAITLVDGRVITSVNVVMAPGVQYFINRPSEYDHLPKELVSHTADHHTFDDLAGKSVVMIGGGQSAMESAALAYESGVQVQLVSREALVWIKDPAAFPTHRPFIERLKAPKAGIAPGWFNWIEETFPYGFQRLPRSTKDRLLGGSLSHGPMGSSWLKPRLIGKVPLYEQISVEEVKEADGGLVLTLSNKKTLKADHLILGTGYRPDLKRLPMLGSSLFPHIREYQGSPVLTNHFESTIPGLYFVGFSSFKSCGPYYRFVVGTGAAARRVASSAAQRARVRK